MQEILRLVYTYLSGIWRYRWAALTIAAIACPVGWVYVATLPDVYQSDARVYVDTDSVLAPLISGLVVQSDENRRVAMMTRIMFSRENMEKLARMTDMDLRAKTPAQMDSLVDRLKSRVRLVNSSSNIYRIAYEDPSPDLAKRVVQSMLTIFVESNLGSSRQDQDSAEQFLRREIKDYERRMIEADRKLKEFRVRNLDFVTSKGDYYQQLRSARDSYAAAQGQLELARKRLEEMEGQMEGVQAESDEIQAQQYQEWLDASAKAVTAPHDERIQIAESQIDDLLLKYTDLHPEVLALRNTIGRLKAKREAERAEFISLQSGMVSTTENASPLYQEMRLRLSEAIAEVATQEARVENLHGRITELQQTVDQVLQLEAEEQQLTRDNKILGKNHSQLLTRLEKARLTREVDSSADILRFRTLDPPKVPREPSGPNRIGMSSAVFGAALAAGIAIALLISIMRPVFGDRRQLNEALGIPVLGSINMIWTPKQRRRHRMVNLAFALGVLGLVGSFALVLTVFSLGIDVMSYVPA